VRETEDLLYAGVLGAADDELRAEGERRRGVELLVIGREEKDVEVVVEGLGEGEEVEGDMGDGGLDRCMPRTCAIERGPGQLKTSYVDEGIESDLPASSF
jgi:hypothetical protein